MTDCANCGATLTGPYCAECGQHAHESARSMGALCHDAWHSVTHLDGRFWATLRALLLRPGQLTLEYFAARRARYLPPFRLYLVLSLVFFGLTSLTTHVDADAPRSTPVTAPAGSGPAPASHAAVDPPASPAGGLGINFDLRDCNAVESSFGWLQQVLRSACRRQAADHGRNLVHAFFANVPRMMFVFLPLMALVMRLMYWRPARYYVEHLVFFLHVHAALFLLLSASLLLDRALAAGFARHDITPWADFVAAGYAAWYVYRALRTYYGQGRWLTLFKYATLACTYLMFLLTTLATTLLVSALTA